MYRHGECSGGCYFGSRPLNGLVLIYFYVWACGLWLPSEMGLPPQGLHEQKHHGLLHHHEKDPRMLRNITKQLLFFRRCFWMCLHRFQAFSGIPWCSEIVQGLPWSSPSIRKNHVHYLMDCLVFLGTPLTGLYMVIDGILDTRLMTMNIQ